MTAPCCNRPMYSPLYVLAEQMAVAQVIPVADQRIVVLDGVLEEPGMVYPTFTCQFCGLLFTARLRLGAHMIAEHRIYVHHDNLNRQLMGDGDWTMSPSQPSAVVCPFCMEVFWSEKHLKEHFSVEHPEPVNVIRNNNDGDHWYCDAIRGSCYAWDILHQGGRRSCSIPLLVLTIAIIVSAVLYEEPSKALELWK